MFNDGGYPQKVESGELTIEIRRSKHPAPPGANQPHCTHSQILAYLELNGNRVAVVHQYLRVDGSLGGSGKPDPKALLVDGILYFLHVAPPTSSVSASPESA